MMQELTQELKHLLLDTIRDVHTAVPGKILKFDPDTCEASVQPTAKFRKPDGSLLDFPQIHAVPVFFPQALGQKVTFTWRVEPGDEVIVFFLEQALDQWRTGAESATELKFDLQNAFAITGFFAKANPLVKRAHENESIILQRGYGGDPEETFVELYDGKIETQVQYSKNAIATYHLMVDGREDNLAFTVKDLGGEKTVTLAIDGGKGQIHLKTKGPIAIESEASITMKAPRIDLNP
jgi:hypothetical protein